MQVLLMRHGEASFGSPSGRDADRELTRRGRRQARVVGAGLGALEQTPDTLRTSPLLRALTTAEQVAEGLPSRPRLVREPLLDGSGSIDGLLPVVLRESAAGRVLWIGHQPELQALTQALLGDRAPALDVATVVCLEAEAPAEPGTFALAWVRQPDEFLTLLGGAGGSI